MAQFKQGMNPEAVSGAGDKLIGFKNEIDGIVSAVDTAINVLKSNWEGNDADQFKSDWNSHRNQVQTCGEALNQMGKKCKTNADLQSKASS